MSDVTRDLLHEILEGQYVGNASLSASRIAIEKENFGKMKSAYNACLKEDAIKTYSVKPVRDLLDELEKYYPAAGPEPSADKEGLTKALVWLAQNSVDAIVNASPTVNPHSSLLMLICTYQIRARKRPMTRNLMSILLA